MTPADEAHDMQLANLLRDAAYWTPEHCEHVAGVFQWLVAHGGGLTAAPMQDAAAQLYDLARAKEEHRAPLQKRINQLSESHIGVVELFLDYLTRWSTERTLLALGGSLSRTQLAGRPSRAEKDRDLRELLRLCLRLPVSAQGALLTCARLLKTPGYGRDLLINLLRFFRQQG